MKKSSRSSEDTLRALFLARLPKGGVERVPAEQRQSPPRVANCSEAALRCKDIDDSEANSPLWTNESVLGACL